MLNNAQKKEELMQSSHRCVSHLLANNETPSNTSP
jgi:hypothetical protein